MPRASVLLGRRSTGVAGLVALLVLVQIAGAAGATPRAAGTTVLAITQSDHVTDQGTFTVAIHVTDATQVSFAYFTFCQLTSPLCYSPVAMTNQGSNWLSGTTKPMPAYPGMTQGTAAGYNITVDFIDSTNLTEPSFPNAFSGLTIATSVSGYYYYRMAVQDPVYNVTGVVADSVTGHGVAGAAVELTPGNNTTFTDASGAYAFTNLLNGTYQLTVTEPGYANGSLSVMVAGLPVSQNIPLTNTTAGTGGGTGTPTAAPSTTPWMEFVAIGAVALILVALLAVVYARRRGRTPPS